MSVSGRVRVSKCERGALLAPIGCDLRVVEATQGQIHGVRAVEDRLDDVGRKVGETQDLPDIALGHAIRFCDLDSGCVGALFEPLRPVMGERDGLDQRCSLRPRRRGAGFGQRREHDVVDARVTNPSSLRIVASNPAANSGWINVTYVLDTKVLCDICFI